MINLKILSAAAVLTLALPVIDSTASYAQGGHGHGGGARGGGGGAHMGMGGGGPRMGMGGGRYHGGGRYYRGGGGGGFVPGLIAGGIIGGALAAPYAYGGYGYGGYGPYAGNAYYGAPPAYDYDDETVEVAPGGGDVDYCIRTFKSYNVRTGTYLGYDGLRHACP